MSSNLRRFKLKLVQIVYNHQIFATIQAFVEAYHRGTVVELPGTFPRNNETDWSGRYRGTVSSFRDLDYLPGPRQVSLSGLRFRVDPELQYVSWLGWNLFLGFDRDMGLSLWDIRFLGERIIYEVRSLT